MDWQKERKRFNVAFEGLWYLLKTEVHFRFHAFASVLVLILAAVLGVRISDWLILILCIVLVLSLEAINTCIEHLLDVLHPEHHKMIGKAKDLAATAVLMSAAGAAVIGLIIFIPYFIDML